MPRLTATTPTNSNLPFKSAVALGKATTTAKRAQHCVLPSTRNRKKAVIRKLRDVCQKRTPLNEQSGTAHEHKGVPETIEAVQSFYQRDDISRQCLH